MRPSVEFAGHDAHLAGGQVQRGAGEPAVDGGGGGEEADAGELSVAPGVVGLALLEAELDAAAVEFARHDAHRRAVAVAGGVVFLGGGGGGHDGAAQDGEQGDDRRGGAAPVTAGPAAGGGSRSSRRVVTAWRAPALIGHRPSASQAGAVR